TSLGVREELVVDHRHDADGVLGRDVHERQVPRVLRGFDGVQEEVLAPDDLGRRQCPQPELDLARLDARRQVGGRDVVGSRVGGAGQGVGAADVEAVDVLLRSFDRLAPRPDGAQERLQRVARGGRGGNRDRAPAGDRRRGGWRRPEQPLLIGLPVRLARGGSLRTGQEDRSADARPEQVGAGRGGGGGGRGGGPAGGFSFRRVAFQFHDDVQLPGLEGRLAAGGRRPRGVALAVAAGGRNALAGLGGGEIQRDLRVGGGRQGTAGALGVGGGLGRGGGDAGDQETAG